MIVLDSLGRLGAVIESAGPTLTSRELLVIIRDTLGLRNAAYLALHCPPLTRNHFYSEVTYSDDWVSRYIEKDYVKIDPVIPTDSAGILPIDWADIDRTSPVIRNFFIDAANHGVGNQGITIPIRGAKRERAFFSVNMQATANVWKKFKCENIAILQIVAHYYHNKVLETHGIKFPDVSLTPRQVEALRWAANGKSTRDIADIMGLSHHTVMTYLETARFRLNALNTTHAAGRAFRIGLIDPPD